MKIVLDIRYQEHVTGSVASTFFQDQYSSTKKPVDPRDIGYIQRLNTRGGISPTGASEDGSKRAVPYT